MHRIRTILTSIGSLGAFGLVLFLITLIVALTWMATGAVNPLAEQVHAELLELDLLEDEISYQLLEMDLNADYYDFSFGEELYLQGYQEAEAALRAALADYDDQAGFLPQDYGYHEELLMAVTAHSQAFEALQLAVAEDDPGAIEAVQAALAEQARRAQETISDWAFQVELRRVQASERMTARLLVAVVIGALGLAATPLLAYWAFGLAGGIVRPILALNDAVVTIQGGAAQPQGLAEVAERRDNLGQLAGDIEVMATQINARRQALEAELEGLREQIKVERRRKRT